MLKKKKIQTKIKPTKTQSKTKQTNKNKPQPNKNATNPTKQTKTPNTHTKNQPKKKPLHKVQFITAFFSLFVQWWKKPPSLGLLPVFSNRSEKRASLSKR